MTIPALPPLPPADDTSLGGSDFNQTSRIDEAFQLIVNLLETLESVGISQSENLNFVTDWEQAYTNLMSKIPVFVASSSIFGGTDTTDSNTRDDVNRINSTYLEQIRAENSELGDTAKSIQTNISQTNDEVTQLGNLATSFMQELSTILSTIFR